MKTKLIYWLLARFPRPMIVTGLMTIKFVYWWLILWLCLVSSFLLAVYSVPSARWISQSSGALIAYLILFTACFLFLLAAGIAFVFAVVRWFIIDNIYWTLKLAYRELDDQLPTREKKS